MKEEGIIVVCLKAETFDLCSAMSGIPCENSQHTEFLLNSPKISFNGLYSSVASCFESTVVTECGRHCIA